MMDGNVRAQVRRRAANRCEYCLLPQEAAPFPLFHVEHICPLKHGGTDDPENLCLACNQCNLHKASNLSGLDPETRMITRLFHPRTDRWDEHFQLDAAVIIGISPIGRTTARVMNMNDADRIEVRLTAIELGLIK